MAESVAAETFEFDNFWVEADYSARRVFAGGELDLATCPSLVDTVADLIALRAGDVVIVLDDITFIDAHTFGALVRISNHQHRHGARLHLTGNARVMRVAHLCDLESLLATN